MRLSNITLSNLSTISSARILAVGALSSACLLAQPALADDVVSEIPLDLSGMTVTKHEIAVMQVISEMCPSMLNDNEKQRFYKAYNTQLHELMPTLDDPKAAIQYLSTQQDYRQVLQGIRTWTMGFSQEENQALCEDLANASF